MGAGAFFGLGTPSTTVFSMNATLAVAVEPFLVGEVWPQAGDTLPRRPVTHVAERRAGLA
jgi:hypothetical protein